MHCACDAKNQPTRASALFLLAKSRNPVPATNAPDQPQTRGGCGLFRAANACAPGRAARACGQFLATSAHDRGQVAKAQSGVRSQDRWGSSRLRLKTVRATSPVVTARCWRLCLLLSCDPRPNPRLCKTHRPPWAQSQRPNGWPKADEQAQRQARVCTDACRCSAHHNYFKLEIFNIQRWSPA